DGSPEGNRRIELKVQLRDIPQFQAFAQVAPDETCSLLKARHGLLLFRLTADATHIDAGMPQIGRYHDPRDRGHRQSRVFELAEQQIRNFRLNKLRNADWTIACHDRSPHLPWGSTCCSHNERPSLTVKRLQRLFFVIADLTETWAIALRSP